MGSPLPRGQTGCPRLTKASSLPPLPSTSPTVSQGRTRCRTLGQRRLTISAFLFNPTVNGGRSNQTKDAITNRLSELRNRSEDEDRAFINDRSNQDADDHLNGDGLSESEAERAQRSLGPWPAASGDGAGSDSEGLTLTGAGAAVTPRSLRYLTTDPKPEIKLLHRFKPGHGPDADFWRSFVDKCRLAWGVFFPPMPRSRQSGIARWASSLGRILTAGPSPGGLAPTDGAGGTALSAKQVVLSRLQMVLIADRCGVSPEQLLEMKAQTLTALAEYMGKDLDDNVAQLEVQVSALKPNGERVTMTIGFADMLGDEQLRDPLQYHYEFEDDDDYFLPEEDDGRVAEIAEAPCAGLQAVRVAATPIVPTAQQADGGAEAVRQ